MTDTSSQVRHDILRVRECITSGERAAIHRQSRRGHIVAIGRGTYVKATLWASMDERTRYLARIHAAATTLDPQAEFSHYSAIALWNLPLIGNWPHTAHIVSNQALGGRSTASVVRHTTGTSRNPATIDGLSVTPLAKTVLDIARTVAFDVAVVIADAALRRTTHPLDGLPVTNLSLSELYEELDLVPLRRGSAKARSVINFADARADRPGESLSRVNIHRARLLPPELQTGLQGRSGRTWFADFWWPEFNLIGEFDGRWKYTDPEFLRGRTPHEVLLDEKKREDDLRAAGYRFSRWGWETALSPSRLRSHLLAAGLR